MRLSFTRPLRLGVVMVALLLSVGSLSGCVTTDASGDKVRSGKLARKAKTKERSDKYETFSLSPGDSNRSLDRRLLKRGQQAQFAPAFESY